MKTAEQIFQEFTTKFKKLAEETLGDVESEFLPWVDSDLTINYGIQIQNDIEGRVTESVISKDYGRTVREKIFEEHKDELVAMLNQDLLKEVAYLKEHIEYLDRLLGRR